MADLVKVLFSCRCDMEGLHNILEEIRGAARVVRVRQKGEVVAEQHCRKRVEVRLARGPDRAIAQRTDCCDIRQAQRRLDLSLLKTFEAYLERYCQTCGRCRSMLEICCCGRSFVAGDTVSPRDNKKLSMTLFLYM